MGVPTTAPMVLPQTRPPYMIHASALEFTAAPRGCNYLYRPLNDWLERAACPKKCSVDGGGNDFMVRFVIFADRQVGPLVTLASRATST